MRKFTDEELSRALSECAGQGLFPGGHTHGFGPCVVQAALNTQRDQPWRSSLVAVEEAFDGMFKHTQKKTRAVIRVLRCIEKLGAA